MIRRLKAIADAVNSIEDDYTELTDAELRELTDKYRERLADGETVDDLLPEAFATVREAACRTLGQRDAEWMGRVHRFLGLEIGVILPNQDPALHKAAYLCDITYGTNNEFGFDYLRDNMAWSKDG